MKYFIILSVIIIIVLYFLFLKKKPEIKNNIEKIEIKMNGSKYKGLVLFDIDGTLTTGKENSEVVEYCINNDYAVGICTAGSIYNMANILSFNWMPINLYKFITSQRGIPFNNVASEILNGQYNPTSYQNILPEKLDSMLRYGYLKGYALRRTGMQLGIYDPANLYLCDDLEIFAKGVKAFNKNLNVICSGEDCGGELTVQQLKNHGI